MTETARQRAADPRAAASRRILRSGLPLLIGAGCIWLLSGRLEGLDFQAVVEVVRSTSVLQWVMAAAATALSFWAIGTYDLVMHRHLRTGVSPRVARITGAGSIALAQVLGLGMVTGALARWRMLAGMAPATAAAVTGAVALSFMASWGLIVVLSAAVLPGVSLPVWVVVASLAAASGLVALAFQRPMLRLGPLVLRLPSLRALAAIVMLTALDIAAAALALYVLLPAELDIGYAVLLPVFAIALGAGLFSSTPGGAGPFELALLALMPQVAEAPLLGAVLAWRVVYYAVPALLALVPLAFPFQPSEFNGTEDPADGDALAHAPRAECGVARQNGARILNTGSGRAVVAETGQAMTLLFDPLTGTSDDVLPALSVAARDRMLIPAIYKCSAPLALEARRAGWQVVRVADDAVVDASGYSTDGASHRQLRRKLRQAEKAGVTVTREKITDALTDELRQIDAHWTDVHQGARGFSMGWFCPLYIADQQIFVARQNGKALAFITLHDSSRDLALDLMRHAEQVPDGTMHLLVNTAIETARDEGRKQVTLAAMPATPPRESRIATRLRDRASAASGGAGLTRFKESFGPRRQPLYMAAPDSMTLALAAADIAKAIRSPGA